MSSALVSFFSGTGNTARVAELIADALRAQGHDVMLLQVRRGAAAPGPERSTLCVFCFPVYACGIPHIMRRYLKRLSAVENGRAAVVCTIGDELVTHRDGRRTHIPGFAGHALVEAAAILRRRGYDVFLTDAIPYPLNWTQVVSAPRPDICAELWRGGDEKAAAVARRIAAGERSIRRFSRAHLLWTLPFDRLYALIGRRRLARLFVSGSNCNACGFCVRNCPAQAIKLVAARPRWTMKCEGCQRCINTCPGNAIQTSWLRVIAELVLTLLPLLPLILRLQDGHRARLLGAAINPWVELLLWAMAYALCFALTDAVSFACEFVPGLRWLVRLNFTRHYRRYLEPHFRPR